MMVTRGGGVPPEKSVGGMQPISQKPLRPNLHIPNLIQKIHSLLIKERRFEGLL